MELKLNQDLIDRCNNNSQFNSGDALKSDAIKTFARFDLEFQEAEGLTEEQLAFLQRRKADFKNLVEEAYNNQLSNRANFVPWNVAGRANCPSAKMNKLADRNMEKSLEWSEKINRFIENTKREIKGLTPLESVLEDYRNGKWKHGEVISSDDPHAMEKLNAKLEYLNKHHDRMKVENRLARKEKRNPPYSSYELTNNLASIKATSKRIKELEAVKENQRLEGFEFEGGEVTADYDLNRLQIYFDEKPDENLRSELKSNGFRWAPSQEAWQRQLTENALYAAKRILM